MNANDNIKALDLLQERIKDSITVFAAKGDDYRLELMGDALMFCTIARESLAIDDLDRAGRALERAQARIKEASA